MLIACVVLVVLMMTGAKKDTYYGIMKNDSTIEKMVSEKDQKVEKMSNFQKTQMQTFIKEILSCLLKMKIQTNSLVYLK